MTSGKGLTIWQTLLRQVPHDLQRRIHLTFEPTAIHMDQSAQFRWGDLFDGQARGLREHAHDPAPSPINSVVFRNMCPTTSRLPRGYSDRPSCFWLDPLLPGSFFGAISKKEVVFDNVMVANW
jgi:hypothetical protein